MFGETETRTPPERAAPLPEYDRQELPHLRFPGALGLPGVGPAPGVCGLHASQQHLRRTKLTYDGEAVACNIKVSFDSTKPLSEASRNSSSRGCLRSCNSRENKSAKRTRQRRSKQQQQKKLELERKKKKGASQEGIKTEEPCTPSESGKRKKKA